MKNKQKKILKSVEKHIKQRKQKTRQYLLKIKKQIHRPLWLGVRYSQPMSHTHTGRAHIATPDTLEGFKYMELSIQEDSSFSKLCGYLEEDHRPRVIFRVEEATTIHRLYKGGQDYKVGQGLHMTHQRFPMSTVVTRESPPDRPTAAIDPTKGSGP